MIRLVQLFNSFYVDKMKGDSYDLSENSCWGDYCSLGYFDAVKVSSSKLDSEQPIWELLCETEMNEEQDGMYSTRNLICMVDSSKKDEEFWKEAKCNPYLFISLIKLKNRNELHKMIKEENISKHTIAYNSDGQCDVVVMWTGNSFKEGKQQVIDLHKYNTIKIYTISSIRNRILINIDNEEISAQIEDESVHCRIVAVLKRHDQIEQLIERLKERLKTSSEDEVDISWRYMLGSSDIEIYIRNISILKLLSYYRTNELLTMDVFYSLESEIIPGNDWR